MRRRLLIGVVLAVAGAACGGEPGQDITAVESQASSHVSTIGVTGNHLTKNGELWVPKGLSLIGSLTKGSALTAYDHWGPDELEAATSWGADTLRMQVSQPALDPQSSEHSSAYLVRVKDMVALAQQHDFTVILSMQDQSLAGGNADPLPTTSTVRAWDVLAPVFATNAGVIYELYNEPENKADAAGWAAWKNGASGTVGHQHLVDVIRAAGAKNVLIADGAQFAEVLTGVPMLSDSLHRMAYAFHPYYFDAINSDSHAWDERFGTLSATVPVVATEWNAQSDGGGNCHADSPTRAPELVAYMAQHHIGQYGWAFDLPGTLVINWSWHPTTLANFKCGQPGGGIGALLKSTYTH